jgi:peroxisomal enoyl-CoA hydratase 2
MASAPPRHESIPTSREPDWVVREKTTPEQALIYRLSGDYNPLHIGACALPPLLFASSPILTPNSDPRIGASAGFGGVILHGLATFGFAARAILHAVGGGEPSALRYFGVRFTAPVMPGDELETRAWAVNRGSDGTTEVAFEVKNVTTEKVRWQSVSLCAREFCEPYLFFRSSLVVVLREWSRRRSLGYE